jgi:hypothetical protein
MDSTQTTQHLLLHSLQVNLVMDTSLKTEVFGCGVLKMKTGTTLVTLKDQQVLPVQTVQPVQQVHKVLRV